MIGWENFTRQIITFCAVGVLFLGSLYYFIAVAYENRDYLIQLKQNQSAASFQDPDVD